MSNKETLQEYNTRLSDNNVSLVDVIERINNLPKLGDNGIPLNLFIQNEEPETKEGIWIQLDNYNYNQIDVVDVIPSLKEEWLLDGTYDNIPTNTYGIIPTVTNDKIYIMGGEPNPTVFYEFDPKTNTYTQLTNTEQIKMWNGIVVAHEDNVYLIGGQGSPTKVYQYNITNQSITDLGSTPTSGMYVVPFAKVGNKCYIFGTFTSTTSYVFDLDEHTFTSFTSAPTVFANGCATAVGTDIYIFGSKSSTTLAYKYDTINDTYTSLTNTPFGTQYGAAVAVGTNVHLLGSYTSGNNTKHYIYNTLTDTYTQGTNIPYAFYGGGGCFVNNAIFLIGGTANQQKVQAYVFGEELWDTNTIAIENGTKYSTQLYTNPLINGRVLNQFNRVALYDTTSGFVDTNILYGDGTDWIAME